MSLSWPCIHICILLIQADNSSTALILASEHGHGDIVKLLAAKGANLNHQNAVNLFHFQCFQDYIDFLLQKGGTPLQYASMNGHTSTVKLLISLGAHIEVSSSKKVTLSLDWL